MPNNHQCKPLTDEIPTQHNRREEPKVIKKVVPAASWSTSWRLVGVIVGGLVAVLVGWLIGGLVGAIVGGLEEDSLDSVGQTLCLC